MSVRCRVVEQNDFARSAAESLAEMCVYPAFPVAMAKRGGRRCDGKLMGHEEIVRYRVRREVCKVSKTKCAHWFRLGLIVDLETDIP